MGVKKIDIRTLRRMAKEIGYSVYSQGEQWIASCPADSRGLSEQIPLHYSITTEREALAWGLGRAGLVRYDETGDLVKV